MKNKDRRKNEFGKENVKIMKNNNRIWKKAMALLLSAGLISGCGNSVSEAENAEVESEVAAVSQMDAATVAGKEDTNNGDTFKVVCTIFPEYDWVKELVGELSDNYEITMLLDNGTDLHSYQPTVEDTISILRGLKERFEIHHGVRITDNALIACATLSERYISDRFLPDKAIDLMDEAAEIIRT